MGRLVDGLKAFVKEATKPESFRKGDKFEAYVRKWIFTDEHYGIISKTHGYEQNKKDFVGASLEPDFLLVDDRNDKEFFVETKYRSTYWDNAIEWSYPDQFKRYKQIDKDIPVFVVIGVEGSPSNPEDIFIFPVRKVKYHKLFLSVLEDFEWEPDTPMRSKHLWGLLK